MERLVGRATQNLKVGTAAKSFRHTEQHLDEPASQLLQWDWVHHTGESVSWCVAVHSQHSPHKSSGWRQLQTLASNGRDNGTDLGCLPKGERLRDSLAQCNSQLCDCKVQGWGLDSMLWAQKSRLPEQCLETRPYFEKKKLTRQSSKNPL